MYIESETIENYGTGIGRIINEYSDYNLKPFIEISENIFKITLPNLNYTKRNNKTIYMSSEGIDQEKLITKKMSSEEIIIEYVREKTKITRLEVEKILNIGNTRSKQIINKLLENNILIKKGNGRSTYYILK